MEIKNKIEISQPYKTTKISFCCTKQQKLFDHGKVNILDGRFSSRKITTKHLRIFFCPECFEQMKSQFINSCINDVYFLNKFDKKINNMVDEILSRNKVHNEIKSRNNENDLFLEIWKDLIQKNSKEALIKKLEEHYS